MPDPKTLDQRAPTPRRPDPRAPVGPPGYDLLDEVGRGGMGAVYRAWDRELDREVAVKLLRPDLPPGTDIVARFADEARITGQLQHPGIPPVYRVGTTPDGRPYMAMKLIHGKTLSALLAAGEPIDVPAVFEGIAQAVGYAHAHGVVHRDLKPSNVMVGAFGEVQVMDWGLAKVLAPGRPVGGDEAPAVPGVSSARDAETVAGSVLGTPGYMAPEQARGDVRAIDARTDVFGLGGILCAMLTGQPPFAGEDAESVRRRAARGDTGEAFARLDASGADPGLVGLCKRCLAASPDDRPSSGNAVAEAVAALRRAADARAAQAERDKVAAEVGAVAAARRRRLQLAAAGGLAAVLALGVAGTGYGLVRAEGKRVVAEDAQKLADRRRQEAEAARTAEAEQKRVAVAKEAEATTTLRFFEDNVFKAARPDGVGGRGLGKDISLRAAIAAAEPALTKQFAGQPLVEAKLRRTLGTTYMTLGDFRAARAQFERARALYAEFAGPDHPNTLDCATMFGTVGVILGRAAEVTPLLEQVADTARRTLGPDHKTTLSAEYGLAKSYYELGRLNEALKLRERVHAARARVLGPDHDDTLNAAGCLAQSYADAGRRDEALRLREQVYAACTRAYGPDHPNTLHTAFNLANSYADVGRRDEALKLRELVYAGYIRVFGPDHPDTLLSAHSLANSYAEAGRRDEALRLLERVYADDLRILGPDHPDTLNAANSLANSHAEAGRRDEALRLREMVHAGRLRILGPDHPDTVASGVFLAEGYADAGRHADALKLREQVYATRLRTLGPDHPSTLPSASNLAISYMKVNRLTDAIKIHQQIYATRNRLAGPDHADTQRTRERLVRTLVDAGRGAEAGRLIDDALAQATTPAAQKNIAALRKWLTPNRIEIAPSPRPVK